MLSLHLREREMSSVKKGESEERGKKHIFWVCSPKNDFGWSSSNDFGLFFGFALSIIFFNI